VIIKASNQKKEQPRSNCLVWFPFLQGKGSGVRSRAFAPQSAWRSTTGVRGRPPALTRLARRSRRPRATNAPSTLSRLAREGTGEDCAPRRFALLDLTPSPFPLGKGRRNKEAVIIKASSQDRTLVSGSHSPKGRGQGLGLCVRFSKCVVLHHRWARTPAGSHPAGTPVAKTKSDQRHPPSLAERERGSMPESRDATD
jgi:hypothetical protein